MNNLGGLGQKAASLLSGLPKGPAVRQTLRQMISPHPGEMESPPEPSSKAQGLDVSHNPPAALGPPPEPERPHAHRTTEKEKIELLNEALTGPKLQLAVVRHLVYEGIPESPGLRVLVWKVLLGLLPPERDAWEATLARSRAEYARFVEELITEPQREMKKAADDHPLALEQSSVWNKYFKDGELRDQIARDVERTRRELHFFNAEDGTAEVHRQALQRVLFVFAKTNPGLQYVQGMNELLAPFYYLCATDATPGAAEHAEADSFYCLVLLMGDFRDVFCQKLDETESGVKGTLRALAAAMQESDPEVARHLDEVCKVSYQFFAFRWITLLLTQEFALPDILRLWDSILSDSRGRLDCLLRLCCAMLINVRGQLLQGDFATNLKLLQSYPSADVGELLAIANRLRPAALHLGR